MEIKRDDYLNKLINRENNGLIKVITGLRRSGKSYLLFNLYYNYLISKGIDKSHIIDIALDDRTNKELRNPDNMLKFIKEKITDDKLYYILLDEIQYLDEGARGYEIRIQKEACCVVVMCAGSWNGTGSIRSRHTGRR